MKLKKEKKNLKLLNKNLPKKNKQTDLTHQQREIKHIYIRTHTYIHIYIYTRAQKQKKKREEIKKIPRAATKLVELATIREDDESHLSITENRKLISFLQQPISSLSKRHLPVYLVLYSLQLNPPSSHILYFPLT